jgi:hypothetical protein
MLYYAEPPPDSCLERGKSISAAVIRVQLLKGAQFFLAQIDLRRVQQTVEAIKEKDVLFSKRNNVCPT